MKQAHEIREIAGWLAATDIEYLELRMPGGDVRLGWRDGEVVELRDGETAGVESGAAAGTSGAAAAAGSAAAGVASLVTVKAPSLGVFLHAYPGSDMPFARVGDRVQAGRPLGLLRVGVLLLPVHAMRSGTVTALRADDGATVGYGAPLVDLQPH